MAATSGNQTGIDLLTMNDKRVYAFASVFFLGLLVLVGCERQARSPQNRTIASWTNLLQTSRATILNGSWRQAENCWTDLIEGSRDADHLQLWIQFQIDILEITRN